MKRESRVAWASATGSCIPSCSSVPFSTGSGAPVEVWAPLARTDADLPVPGFEGLERGEAERLPLLGLTVEDAHRNAAPSGLVQHLHQRAEGGRVHVLDLGEVQDERALAAVGALEGFIQDGDEEPAGFAVIAAAAP